jgi:hypothetical protein
MLIATPATKKETGGTWYTINYLGSANARLHTMTKDTADTLAKTNLRATLK